jgi:isopentenyl-diphosphate delta-isomerase
MSDSINARKREHIQILHEDPATDRCKFYFDAIRLTHRALPQIDYDAIDTGTIFLGKPISLPLIISCMTGGNDTEIGTINRHLAAAAEQAGVAMGLGSQRVMLSDPAAKDSFMLRDIAPSIPLLGNLGAVQLNHGVTASDCQRLVDEAGLDALYLHLNPLQEAVQPEGDRCFGNLAKRIGEVVAALSVPVIVKEVGAGISPADAELLIAEGVTMIDVAGSGGTSWSRIEYHRDTTDCSPGRLFQDWGIPTPQALELLAPYRDRVSLIASGGIRSGLDMAKCFVLGATLCGIARPFLDYAQQSPDAVIRYIAQLERQFHTAMFLMGQACVDSMIGNRSLLLNRPSSTGEA